MHRVCSFTSLAAVIGSVLAWAPPDYSSAGMTNIWVDEFEGDANTLPNTSNWNIITGDLGVNDELETYTDYIENVQLSGGATVQLIPEYDVNGIEWSSGRIESVYTFTPAAGLVTWAESCFRFGTNAEANKQGIWPAFWLLGEAFRENGEWPACGEIDVMEEVDGEYTAYGTIHWLDSDDDDEQYQDSTSIPDYSWHYWRVEWDRTSDNWEEETITWYLDSVAWMTVTASTLGYDEESWEAVCHSPLYFILNVAIGGTMPGYPNDDTWCGSGSMLEAAYVGVWQS